MRQKQIYKPNEITTDLYTWGEEWQTEDGVEYKGLYHKYTTGEIYTQPVWDELTSQKLVKYQIPDIPIIALYKTLHKNKIQTNYKQPISVLPIVTDTDKTNGYFHRYFIKKNNEDIIIEIDKTQYTEWQDQLIDPNLYTAIKLQWQIAGWRIDALNNNKTTVKLNNAIIPGLIVKLVKYDEFYVNDPSSILIPVDINKSVTSPGSTSTTNNTNNTQQNKTILDETGKLATDEIAEQIKKSIFIDVDNKRIEFNSQQQFVQSVNIQPITKYIKNGITTIHPFYNVNGYSYKLSDRKLGTITSDTQTLAQRDGSSKTRGKQLVFTPNVEEISNRSNEQATINIYPTDITDLTIQPATVTLFINIGN